MTELLNCPFCGGQALHFHMAFGAVRCKDCGATGPAVQSSPDCHIQEATAWNRRSSTPIPDSRDAARWRKLLTMSKATLIAILHRHPMHSAHAPHPWTLEEEVDAALAQLETLETKT